MLIAFGSYDLMENLRQFHFGEIKGLTQSNNHFVNFTHLSAIVTLLNALYWYWSWLRRWMRSGEATLQLEAQTIVVFISRSSVGDRRCTRWE